MAAAAATVALDGQDAFFAQQASQQQALEQALRQQAHDSQGLGALDFDTQNLAAHEQLQVGCHADLNCLLPWAAPTPASRRISSVASS